MANGLTVVIGGAASGKSVWAEEHVTASGLDRVYLATAQAFDPEMRDKIDRHIGRRGDGWTTIEAPLTASGRLRALGPGSICLMDCATLWLSNQILAEADIDAETDDLLTAMDRCAARLVVVSNEVGHGVVPDNALARRFREAQGRLNILLAAQADTVVQVTAGLPRALKGALA